MLYILGTLFGWLVVWWLEDDTIKPQLIRCRLEQKVDKITIRHEKIVMLQGGFVTVYNHNERRFDVAYSKTFEDPDKTLLYSASQSDKESDQERS